MGRRSIFSILMASITLILFFATGRPATAIAPLPQLEVTITPESTQTMEFSQTPEPPVESEAASIVAFLPLMMRQPAPIPPEKILFCAAIDQPLSIPDNQPSGVSSNLSINDPRMIADLEVLLNISHTWVGDLWVQLVHQETGRGIRLIDQPGIPGSQEGCGNDNVAAILDDDITAAVENQCAASPAAVSGIYTPEERLSTFLNENIAGTWTLNVADLGKDDRGKLNNWCLVGSISESPPPPPPTPQPPVLPPQARVRGVRGQNQALPLDCESRVAVDWAAFFGVSIDEFEFLGRLPTSDNPDAGFVGSVYGTWGQIPPNPYGVHAEPVAALLRSYGLSAYAHRPLSWDDLRAEIAAGRPVYVWTIGSSSYNQIPVYYRSQDGHLSIVARYEHTVMVTGYTENNVTIQDGASTYTRSISQFLSSWSALGNMAITTQP